MKGWSYWTALGILVKKELGDYNGKPYYDLTILTGMDADGKEYTVEVRAWKFHMPMVEAISAREPVVEANGKINGKWLSLNTIIHRKDIKDEFDQTPEGEFPPDEEAF